MSMTNIDLVEQVARAIYGSQGYPSWESLSPEHRKPFREMARAAITAMRSSAPQEPDDDAMIERCVAAVKALRTDHLPSIEEIVRATLKAAGTVAQEPVADDDAVWLRKIAVQGVSNEFSDGAKDRLERIADRLQAKAPETELTAEEEAYARREIHEACKPTGEDHRKY